MDKCGELLTGSIWKEVSLVADRKGVAFFERGSWYHRFKLLQEDGTTKYAKKGGFKTAKEAEQSYHKYEAEYKKAYRA